MRWGGQRGSFQKGVVTRLRKCHTTNFVSSCVIPLYLLALALAVPWFLGDYAFVIYDRFGNAAILLPLLLHLFIKLIRYRNICLLLPIYQDTPAIKKLHELRFASLVREIGKAKEKERLVCNCASHYEAFLLTSLLFIN